MQTRYDLICIGFGPATREIIRLLPDLDILIVSNRRPTTLPNINVMSYAEFFDSLGGMSPTRVIVSIRLEFFSVKFLENLENNSSLWDYLNYCKVILLSSVSVYGSSVDVHLEEDSLFPLDAYSSNKVFLEGLFLRRLPVDSILILRVANLYGTRGLSKFFDQLQLTFSDRLSLSIPSCECVRDFVHIFDLCRFITFWISLEAIPGYQILNFGTGVSLSLIEIIQMAKELGGFDLKINYYAEDPLISVSKISVSKLGSCWGNLPTEMNFGMLDALIKPINS